MLANPMMLPFVIFQRWLELFVFPPVKTDINSIQTEVAPHTMRIGASPTKRAGHRMPYISARIHKARTALSAATRK